MIRIIIRMSSRNKRASKHATFSFDAEDRERIELLRVELGRQGHLLNRSEVVRLGLLVLAEQNSLTIRSRVEKLKRLRPGRLPRKTRSPN
jgi:hypothetical protein